VIMEIGGGDGRFAGITVSGQPSAAEQVA